MTKYKITLPDGTVTVERGRGPWFVAWRLCRRAVIAWGAPDNRWITGGGWVHRSYAKKTAAKLRTLEGWGKDSRAETKVVERLGPGSRLLCAKGNVRIIKGEEVS